MKKIIKLLIFVIVGSLCLGSVVFADLSEQTGIMTYGGTENDYGNSIYNDGTYTYVTGRTNSEGEGSDDVFILKLDSSLNIVERKTYGGTGSDYGNSIYNDGTYTYVTGYTSSEGDGCYDVLILKLDSSLNIVERKTYGGTGSDYGNSIYNDGTYTYVTGHTSSEGEGSNNVFILKLDSSLNIVERKTYGGTGSDVGKSIYNDGTYTYVTGYTSSEGEGSNDVFILKLDSSLNIVERKTYGGTGSDVGNSIYNDGTYTYVTGHTSSEGEGSGDVFISKFLNDLNSNLANETTPTGFNYTTSGLTLASSTQTLASSTQTLASSTQTLASSTQTLASSTQTANYFELFFSFTPTITTNITNFYNTENISIQLNTTPVQNTNMSYSLDNGTITTICNNCNNSILNLNELSEGAHSILFLSTDENGQVNTTENFIIKTTPPTINIFNTSEINSYTINWTNVFNYSGGNYCEVRVENTTTDCNTTYTFQENGNQTVEIYVNDSAGNENIESYTQFVNPYQYFYFEDYQGNPISNFTFGESSYSSAACIPLFDLGYGNHSLNFSKIGYQKTPVPFSLNSTSEINLTTGIGISKVHISIYDRDNLSLINQLVTIDLIGDPDNTDEFSGSYSTSNGTLTIDNISDIPGTYKLELESSGYANNEYYFTQTGFEVKNISIYMIDFNNTFPIKYILQNLDGDPEKFCLFKVKQYFIGSNDYIIVDMGRTNSLGQVIFDLEYDVNYQYVIECDDQTQTEPGQKITETPTTIIFNPDQTLNAFENLPNVVGDVTFGNYSNSSGYFRFEYNDMKNIVSKGCLEIYRKGATSNTLLYSKCQSLPSATLNQDINWTTGDRYVAKGYVWADGQKYLGDQLNKEFLPGADQAWALGFGFWGSILIVLTLFIVGSIHHPITGALLSIMGLLVSIGFKALEVETSLVMGIGIIVVGAILLRRRR